MLGSGVWSGVLGPDSSPQGRWWSLYKPPVEKRMTDRQWRIVHGVIATNRHVAHIVRGCLFCEEEETVDHLFFKCKRLGGLLKLGKCWCEGFKESLQMNYLVLALNTYTYSQRNRKVLDNVILARAKMSVWLTRKGKMKV